MGGRRRRFVDADFVEPANSSAPKEWTAPGSNIIAQRLATASLHTLLWSAAAAVSLSVALAGHDATASGLLLVACGTMAAYGLDRWVDRRDADPREVRRFLVLVVGLASVATAALACTSGWRFRVCAVLAVIAGAYVPLKRAVPKNLLTTVAWTTATATLPFAAMPPLDAAFAASVASVALIMAANTILCDVPDVAADRAAGVKGITPRFGPRAGRWAAALCGAIGAVIAGSVGRWGLAMTAGALLALAWLMARRPDHRGYRLWVDAVVTVIPGPLAWLFR
ncbi:MAG: UbiA family prenyltransferase [Verrucomicrobiales bacterium]|nr:UbiA family prenyltransferase [Verrucomicrobiales bacterium]